MGLKNHSVRHADTNIHAIQLHPAPCHLTLALYSQQKIGFKQAEQLFFPSSLILIGFSREKRETLYENKQTNIVRKRERQRHIHKRMPSVGLKFY